MAAHPVCLWPSRPLANELLSMARARKHLLSCSLRPLAQVRLPRKPLPRFLTPTQHASVRKAPPKLFLASPSLGDEMKPFMHLIIKFQFKSRMLYSVCSPYRVTPIAFGSNLTNLDYVALFCFFCIILGYWVLFWG